MIIKLLLLTPFILFPVLSYAQGKTVHIEEVYFRDNSPAYRKISTTIHYEVETLLPVFRTIEMPSDSFRIEYKFRRKWRTASMDIGYIGGEDKLQRFQDSLYWSFYNGPEINGTCLYTMLFDRNLKIKDIKIIKRGAYDNSRYNFDELIKKILSLTEGSWKKTNDTIDSKYYFRLGRFKVR